MEIIEEVIRLKRPDETVEEIRWDQVTGFDVEITERGGLESDIFWVLKSKSHHVAIPQKATGYGELIKRLHQLPGFNHTAFSDALASKHVGIYSVWRPTN